MKIHLLIFILLFGLVILFHYLLDSSYLNFGMHSDDWISLVRYNALKEDFFHKLFTFWRLPQIGPHATSQIMYMGLLERWLGLNYKLFDLINIIFKILATISLYPLILLVFNRRLVAFLVVVFYSISYSAVGSFHDVHKGTEYQAIFFMNIFLIIYVLFTKKQIISVKWIFALILSFGMTIFLAPPRLFPLIGLPLLIEFFIWLSGRNKYNLNFGIKKIFFLYLPFILVLIYHPNVITDTFVIPISHIQKIIDGYWFILLNPLSGLGYMILWDRYWVQLIGIINLDNFLNYFLFLIFHTSVIFGVISMILTLMISKSKMKVFLFTVIVNFILEILAFFLATNHLKIPTENRVSFDFNALYAVFVGTFIISLSFGCLLDWFLGGKKNTLQLAFWIGCFISIYFVFYNWLFANPFLSFNPTQEYLTVPAIGISLMLAALFTSLYDKIKSTNFLNSGKILAFCILLLLFIPIYLINKIRTTEFLTSIINQNNAIKQQDLQQEIRQKVKLSGGNILVFFDWTGDKLNSEFYSEYLYSTFTFWSHFQDRKIIEGCINEITDKTILFKSFSEKQGKKGFILPGNCLLFSRKDFFVNQQIFYDLDHFYAFRINNNNLTDIRREVLKDANLFF